MICKTVLRGFQLSVLLVIFHVARIRNGQIGTALHDGMIEDQSRINWLFHMEKFT